MSMMNLPLNLGDNSLFKLQNIKIMVMPLMPCLMAKTGLRLD